MLFNYERKIEEMSNRSLIELLKIQNNESAMNSFYRYRKGKPTYIQQENYLLVRNDKHFCKIYRIDEIVLYLIQDFRFLPIWLIQQWYQDFNIHSIFNLLEDWVNCGLVWIQPDSSSIFVRPTRNLLELFNATKLNYEGIPKMFLNHKFSEAQIVFDVLIGNEKSEIWKLIKQNELLPPFQPLNINYIDKPNGSLLIRENWYRTVYQDKVELQEKDLELKKEIISGKKFTKEFSDFRLFQIITDYQTRHGNLSLQIPDIVVPIPRENGEARSIAIEIELTSKGVEKYIKILQNYTDNQKFGKLFYLVGDTRVANVITQAYEKVGKSLGSCELYIIPFTTPAMKLSNYSFEEDEKQKRILRLGR